MKIRIVGSEMCIRDSIIGGVYGLEVKINKEIRNYTESMFFGLSMRQFLFSALACGILLCPESRAKLRKHPAGIPLCPRCRASN